MIKINNIGISLTRSGIGGQLSGLEQNLAALYETGFRMVEVDPTPFALIINGELRRPQMANFAAVLNNFDLRYSMHGLTRLNLAYDSRHDLCYNIMACQIEICRTLGISRMVYHSGLQALDEVRQGLRPTLLTPAELAEGARREVSAFKKLGPLAAEAGVIIGMENGDSHLWEHRLLARLGRPRAELSQHHPRLYIGPIRQQLEAINHPNIAMTLDIAHLHIAAHDMGFDYLEAVSEAAPWVKHLHANDNFGRLDRGMDLEHNQWAFGEADIHLPPGWGCIPYPEVFSRLPTYNGDMILEIKPGFQDYFGEGLQTMQTILADLPAES